MYILRRGLFWTTGVFFLLALGGTYQFGWAQGQPLIFSATGDIPYGTSEISVFQKQLNNQNLYSPSAFFVHVGDILAGSEKCAEARYSLVASMLKGLAVPAYIVPGDNETTDCSSPSQGLNWWLQYFTNFEQNFCGAPATEHQSGRVQNFAFVLNGVLIVGIDLVGSTGTTTSQQQKDADWVNQQFTGKVSQVRAAVVFAQAGPSSDRNTFFNQFVQSAGAFGKPVLFLHGDGHKWVQNNPWSLSNTMRIEVDNGGAEEPVQITVTLNTSSPSSAFSIKRKPSSGAQPYNLPPCANAGPDKSITSSSTSLQGSVTDDGDPGSSLTTNWSTVSGPGTVTFGNANALSTTASFSASGTYVLRLTANDGQLQKSDDVTIGVNATINNAPVISSFTPTSGPVGTAVTISGSNFSGATGVAFNGTTASFTINSDAQIAATVPSGATTGKISVTNANGTGQSVTDFTVTVPPTQYTLTVNVVGSGSVTLNPSGGTYNAGTVVTLTPQSGAGYQFSGWNGDLSGSANPATITMDANKNVTATFTALPPTQYTLTINTSGSGSVSLNPAGGTYDAGTVVTLTANPSTGFQFSGWSGDLTGSTNPATITMDANKNVTATFTALPPNQYSLTINISGSGNVSLNPSGGTYDAGTVVALTPQSGAGYQFSGWSGDLTGSANPATITMDANKNVTATFTALPPNQYSLTINISGSGNVSLNPSGGTYDAGTVVALTPQSGAGYQFSGWSGDLTGSANPATITMDANKSVTATFTASSGSGQVVFEEIKTGGSSSSTTVTTSASLTGVSGQLYLAAIAKKSNVAVSNVSGLGLSWTRVKAQCAGRSQTGVEVWKAQGTSSGNGTVTATLAAVPSNAVIAVSRYSGVDAVNPIGNIISGNTTGANGACSGGTDNTSYSFNLTTTINGAVIYGTAAMRNHTHAPGAGYTERAEIIQGSSAGSQASVAVEDKSVASAGTVVVNGTFDSSVDWAVVALEIKPQITLSKNSRAVDNVTPASPATFQLAQNDPNPFNLSTTIGFSVPVACNVTVEVYDATDQLVRTLVAGEMDPGDYSTSWNGADEFNRPVAAGAYSYKMTVEDEDGNSLFTETRQMNLQPSVFQLDPSYPNPFNASTQIRFNLRQTAHVTIKVYTLNGAEVKTLSDREYPAGLHTLTFHAQNLPSGTYFYVMQAGTARKVQRFMLVK